MKIEIHHNETSDWVALFAYLSLLFILSVITVYLIGRDEGYVKGETQAYIDILEKCDKSNGIIVGDKVYSCYPIWGDR